MLTAPVTLSLQTVLWLLEPALNAAIAAFILRRRLHKRFPVFFAYQIFHFANTIALYGLSFAKYRTYFYAYWSMEPLAVLLTFANIQELFSAMFRQREGLKDFGTMLFRWAIVVMLLMGVVLATTNGKAFERNHFISLVISMERSIQLMMVGLLLFLFTFCSHLGVTRRHHVFGFIVGWGISSAMELLLYTERARKIFADNRHFNTMHVAAYDAMLLVWLGYVLVREAREVLPNMLLRSQRWNEALLETPVLDEQPTLLVGIETIVERALAKAGESKER